MNGLNLRPYLTLFLAAAGCTMSDDVATEATGSPDAFGETGDLEPDAMDIPDVPIFDGEDIPEAEVVPDYAGVTAEEFAAIRMELFCRANDACGLGTCDAELCWFQEDACNVLDMAAAPDCLEIAHRRTLELETSADTPKAAACQDARWPTACIEILYDTCWDDDMPEDEGRPIRQGGSPLLPDLHADLRTTDLDRIAASRVWLRAARAEHGSIAAFARLSQELLALGAPAHLVAACHRAALDEIRHAQACLDTVRSLGVQAEIGVQPQPQPRTPTLKDLAVESLLEGCYGEAVAAIRAETASVHANAEIAETLRTIAEDESRHAALAWGVVDWTLGQDPELAGVLREAMDELRSKVERAEAPAEEEADLRAFGVTTKRQRQAIARAALDGLVAPTLTQVLAKHP